MGSIPNCISLAANSRSTNSEKSCSRPTRISHCITNLIINQRLYGKSINISVIIIPILERKIPDAAKKCNFGSLFQYTSYFAGTSHCLLSFCANCGTENGSISLSAHIVELSAFDNGENGVGVSAVARFRLKNSALTSAFTTVRFSSPVNATLPADLAVTMDGVPANVYVTDGGGLALNVELAAEGSTELQLTYSLSLPKTAIQAIRYPAALLTNWQQRISMSVRIQLPESVVAESVVQIAPDDWIFPADAGQSYAVRWLYDGVPSEQPFSVAFIQPALWGEIVQARQAAMAGSVSDYLRLGDIYASLLGETTGDLRQSFYAQTLAAYNDGIQHSPDPGGRCCIINTRSGRRSANGAVAMANRRTQRAL